MSRTGELIASNARTTLGLGRMLLDGIEPARFARLADGANGPVKSNHPAFVYGHLALYPEMICKTLGDEEAARAVAAPEGWGEIFGAGVECRDDPDGSIYPPMTAIVEAFTSCYERVIRTVEATSDETFDGENPNEGLRERLGLRTIGAATTFVLTSHPMMHLGQVSAWRRLEGLGSVLG